MSFGDIGAGIGSAVGSLAVLAGAGGEGGKKYHKKALDVWRKLKDPNFDYSELSPPELQIVAEYFPEVYEAVLPQEVKLISDSPELRQAQLRGVARLERVAQEGLPTAERISAQEATDAISREHQRGTSATLQDLGERQALSGGDEVQARLAAGQGTTNLAGSLGRNLVRERMLSRLAGTTAAANLAGDVRTQDVSTQAANASYVNRFNELLANLQTNAAQYGAGARERATFANAAERQRVGDFNEQANTMTRLENINRANTLKQSLFNSQLARSRGLSGALSDYGGVEDTERAAREMNIMGLGKGIGQAGGGAVDMAAGGAFKGFGGGGTPTSTISPGLSRAKSRQIQWT